MNLSVTVGLIFLSVSFLFLLGLLPRTARFFYPRRLSVIERSAAPILFACLAAANFKGGALPVLTLVVGIGIPLILKQRSKRRQKIGV